MIKMKHPLHLVRFAVFVSDGLCFSAEYPCQRTGERGKDEREEKRHHEIYEIFEYKIDYREYDCPECDVG